MGYRRGERPRTKKRSLEAQQRRQHNGDKRSENPNGPHEPSGETPNPDQQGEVSQPKKESYEGRGEAAIERYTRQLSRATVGLVVVGVATAGVLFLQYSELRKTDETARISNRAFVYVEKIEFVPEDKFTENKGVGIWNLPQRIGRVARGRFSLINSGNTRATILESLLIALVMVQAPRKPSRSSFSSGTRHG